MKKLYHRNVYWKPQFDEQSLTIIKSVERLSNHLWEQNELLKILNNTKVGDDE